MALGGTGRARGARVDFAPVARRSKSITRPTTRRTKRFGHQELFAVMTGHAVFTVDGEEIDAPAGTIVFVRDPALLRPRAIADDTAMVGGPAGVPYTVSRWEASPPWCRPGRLGALPSPCSQRDDRIHGSLSSPRGRRYVRMGASGRFREPRPAPHARRAHIACLHDAAAGRLLMLRPARVELLLWRRGGRRHRPSPALGRNAGNASGSVPSNGFELRAATLAPDVRVAEVVRCRSHPARLGRSGIRDCFEPSTPAPPPRSA